MPGIGPGTDASWEDATFGGTSSQRTRSTTGGSSWSENSRDVLFTLSSVGKDLTTTYEYDALNRLEKVVDPRGNASGANPNEFKVEYEYDSVGNKIKTTVGALNTTYEYDGVGRLTKTTDPSGNVTEYTYDPVGNLTSAKIKDSAGIVKKQIDYVPDSLGRTIAETDKKINGADVNKTTPYTYDPLGGVMNVFYPEDSGNKFSAFEYDDLARPKRALDINAKSLSYDYDERSNLSKITTHAESTISYSFDEANRLTETKSSIEPANKNTAYTYKTTGEIDKITSANDSNGTFGFDDAGRTENVENKKSDNTAISSYSYEYEATGNIKTLSIDGTVREKYEYDPAPQLTTVKNASDTVTASYTYDNRGNRTSKTEGGVTTNYAYNDLNQLTSVGTQSYTYDVSGNLTSDGTYNYEWDNKNRLTKVSDQNTVVSYAYDVSGNRTSKTVGTTTTYYQYSGSDVVAELDSSGNATISSTREPGGRILSMKKDSNVFYYHYNGHGDVVALTDANEVVVASYEYDAWGRAPGIQCFRPNGGCWQPEIP